MLSFIPMSELGYYVLAMAVLVTLGTFVWMAIVAILVWLGRKVLRDDVGRRWFGHYWDAGRK